ncbi:hypothetical protein TIFTF001_011097 [Ficus carica]|uniref:Uncharacterized protein n=1 Tax=Ficus carica TaxID=3494 RepID=A0AA87ZR28_FICCA|nr:hypothetical protein TIFTF001_011097 [Ficus carica]
MHRRLSRAWVLGATQSGRLPRAPGGLVGLRLIGAAPVRVGGGGWRCDVLQQKVEYGPGRLLPILDTSSEVGCSEHNLARYAVHPGEMVGSSRVSVFSENGMW